MGINILEIIKMILTWIISLIAIKCIPTENITFINIMKFALIGGISFALLDLLVPDISDSVKNSFFLVLPLKILIKK